MRTRPDRGSLSRPTRMDPLPITQPIDIAALIAAEAAAEPPHPSH